MEFDYPELYAPVDLRIGHCRLSVAEPADMAEKDDPRGWSHVRVATKYPHATRTFFEARGVQAECVKLNGAMELAPTLGLAPRIRSEERRVGKGCVSTCGFRWAPFT